MSCPPSLDGGERGGRRFSLGKHDAFGRSPGGAGGVPFSPFSPSSKGPPHCLSLDLFSYPLPSVGDSSGTELHNGTNAFRIDWTPFLVRRTPSRLSRLGTPRPSIKDLGARPDRSLGAGSLIDRDLFSRPGLLRSFLPPHRLGTGSCPGMPPRRSPAVGPRNPPLFSCRRRLLPPSPPRADPESDWPRAKSLHPDPFHPDAPSPRSFRLTDLPDGRPSAGFPCPDRRISRDTSHDVTAPFLRGAPAPETGEGMDAPPPVDTFSFPRPLDGPIGPFLPGNRALTCP